MKVRRAQRRLAVVLAVGLMAGTAAMAQPEPTLAAREAARSERQALRARIEKIERELAATEKTQAQAADALKASEVAISDATRQLAEIQTRRSQVNTELAALERRIGESEAQLERRREVLASLLRQQYRSGGMSPWSVLLSGGDPQETGRDLGYLGYVSQARAAAVQAVAAERQQLESLRADLLARRTELAELGQQHETQRAERLRQQAERKRVLAQLGEQLARQRDQAARLTNDEARLSGLISDINRALEQQRRAAEEARRQAQIEARLAREREQARQRAEAERLAQEARQRARENAAVAVRSTLQERGAQEVVPAPAPPAAAAPTPAAESTPAQVAVLTPERPAASVRVAPASRPVNFATLRGRLSLPARGTVVGRYGEPRDEGGTWRGVFIRAPQETPVHAVAAGTVVFSGWLRGFGNLLILDHGNEYLSVYGNNEAILKQVGEQVAVGEAVASAGASGGQPESGIYFELRHRGSPVDPLQWARPR